MKIIRNLHELKVELCRMIHIADGNTAVIYTEEVLFNMESPTEPAPIYLSCKPTNSGCSSAFYPWGGGNGGEGCVPLNANQNNSKDIKYPGIIIKSTNSLNDNDHEEKTFDIDYIEPDKMDHPMTIKCLLNQIATVDHPEDYETRIVNSNNKPCDLYCALWFCDNTWTCFLIATDKLADPDFDYKAHYYPPKIEGVEDDYYSKTEEMEDE